jgi:uncharacterized membrane protein
MNNDKGMALLFVGAALAAFLYVLINPAAVKAANQAEKYKWVGLGRKPIWYFRTIGAIGCLVSGLILIKIILSGRN